MQFKKIAIEYMPEALAIELVQKGASIQLPIIPGMGIIVEISANDIKKFRPELQTKWNTENDTTKKDTISVPMLPNEFDGIKENPKELQKKCILLSDIQFLVDILRNNGILEYHRYDDKDQIVGHIPAKKVYRLVSKYRSDDLSKHITLKEWEDFEEKYGKKKKKKGNGKTVSDDDATDFILDGLSQAFGIEIRENTNELKEEKIPNLSYMLKHVGTNGDLLRSYYNNKKVPDYAKNLVSVKYMANCMYKNPKTRSTANWVYALLEKCMDKQIPLVMLSGSTVEELSTSLCDSSSVSKLAKPTVSPTDGHTFTKHYTVTKNVFIEQYDLFDENFKRYTVNIPMVNGKDPTVRIPLEQLQHIRFATIAQRCDTITTYRRKVISHEVMYYLWSDSIGQRNLIQKNIMDQQKH